MLHSSSSFLGFVLFVNKETEGKEHQARHPCGQLLVLMKVYTEVSCAEL